MRRTVSTLLLLLALGAAAVAAAGPSLACSGSGADAADRVQSDRSPAKRAPDPTLLTGTAGPSEDERAEQARQAQLDHDFPNHGLVTGTQLVIRDRPDPEGKTLGWLRIGARIRAKAEPEARTPSCSTGWYAIYPTGFACAGEGIQLADQPPQDGFAVAPSARDAPLPYAYYFVKEPMVPEYHQLPSRDQQRAAIAYGARYLEILGEGGEVEQRRARRYLEGALPGELPRPAGSTASSTAGSSSPPPRWRSAPRVASCARCEGAS